MCTCVDPHAHVRARCTRACLNRNAAQGVVYALKCFDGSGAHGSDLAPKPDPPFFSSRASAMAEGPTAGIDYPALVQQLQQQVQLLLGQVQHLNGLSDMQAQRIQGMSDYEAMKTAVIQMQEQQKQFGFGAPSREKFLVDRKEVKVDNFFGEEAKFGDFVEDTKMYSDVVYPELGEVLEWIEGQDKNVTEQYIRNYTGEGFEAFNRTITGFLKVRLRGKARNWLKAQPVGEGLLNWKRMLHKYDPLTGATRLDIQNKITTPGSRCTAVKDVPAAIEAWDAAYVKYQTRMGKELDDEMCQNILLRRLPAKF